MVPEYWNTFEQAQFARVRGEYKVAVVLLGQARVIRLRGES